MKPSPSLPKLIFVNRVYWPSEAATAQLLADLAELLAARGWPVEVLAAGDGHEFRNGVSVVRCGGGKPQESGLNAKIGSYLRFLAAAHSHLKRNLKAGELVVLMTDPPMLAPVLSGLVRRRGGYLINWIQDIYPEIAALHAGPSLGVLTAWLRGPRDAAWQQAHCNITLGGDMSSFVVSRGILPGQCVVLPNWAPAELQAVAGHTESTSLRRRWGINNQLVVAYSGNLGRVHEFETILDAANRLRDYADILFVFVASGPRLSQVKRKARDQGLENVQFFPPVPRSQLRDSLAAADVHLVSLRAGFESFVFPSKIAGVLAASRPILFVGPKNCEVAKLIETRNCGYCFENRDSAGLARSILELRSNRELAIRLGENSRRLYEHCYSLPSLGEQWHGCLSLVTRADQKKHP